MTSKTHKLEENLIGKTLRIKTHPVSDKLSTIDGQLLSDIREINFYARARGPYILTINGPYTDKDGKTINDYSGNVMNATRKYIVEGTLSLKLISEIDEKKIYILKKKVKND